MDNGEQKRQNSFGRDFLTYICYKSDEKAGSFEIPGSGQQVSLWVDGKIVMEDDSCFPPNTVSYSGDDFTNQDLKQAIRSGKRSGRHGSGLRMVKPHGALLSVLTGLRYPG